VKSGDLVVKLPNSDEWKSIKGGDSFEVAANSSFELRVSELTDYCCSYIKES
jgi:uncharacterized protein YaiE (UPF0345 family)